MRRLLLLVGMLLGLVMVLAACGGGAQPETQTIETVVTAVVTQIVEGETIEVIQTQVVELIVTATPEPVVTGPKTFVVCMAQEPETLFWGESALVASAVLEAVQEPMIDTGQYGYQANLVEKLPNFDDGDATREEVTVGEGDLVYDVSTDSVITLTSGMTETFQLNQLEGDPITVEGYNGEELTAVQTTAQWMLIEGLTWEDGEPVTAEDSVFAFNVARDANYTGADKYVADRSASYTAVDERTIEWMGMPGYADGTYFVNIWDPVPAHLLEGMSVVELQEDESVNRDPLSYGAYALDEWVAGESMTLSPNPNYAKGTPPLDQLIFRFVGDTNQLVAQLASGECDLGTQDAAFEGSLPLIRGFEEQGLMEVIDVAGTVYEHLDFNLLPVEGYTGASATLTDSEGGLLFQNVDFRRAIAHCIDRQAIVDGATNGAAFVQHTYTASDHPLYPGDDAVVIYEHDPAGGLELLAGLGWTDTDGDGILDKDGQTLSFIHSTRQNPLREAVTQIVQEQLITNCMIETEIELVGSEYFADGPDGLVFGRKYDMGEFAWLTGVEPPCNLYLSTQIPSEELGWGLQNNTGWNNPDFDAACNEATGTLDEDVKAEQHAAAMRIFTEELPSITLFARAKVAVVRPGVVGVEMDPTINSELWNVENFDIEMGQ